MAITHKIKIMTQQFETALNAYLTLVNETSNRDFETNYPNLVGTEMQPIYKAYQLKKWVRVVREEVQKSVFCFIDPETGDLYKPAGWNTPAKGIRGNIYNEKKPVTCGQFYK